MLLLSLDMFKLGKFRLWLQIEVEVLLEAFGSLNTFVVAELLQKPNQAIYYDTKCIVYLSNFQINNSTNDSKIVLY